MRMGRAGAAILQSDVDGDGEVDMVSTAASVAICRRMGPALCPCTVCSAPDPLAMRRDRWSLRGISMNSVLCARGG
jgi:hypothetical protein